jgi:hypothetical protein
MCVPFGDNEPTKPRVCSKGCNQLLKVDKDFGKGKRPVTKDESKLYDMVVCQADKRVICSPKSSADKGASCTEQKVVKPIAKCPFNIDLWNLGGTCIASSVHNELTGNVGKLCSADDKKAALVKQIREGKWKCTKTVKNPQACSRLAISY